MKIVGLAGVRDRNSITLWGTNNLLGEVTYSCLSVSRLVLSSPHVIWHGASSRWRGVQLEPSVAFFTPELVLLTIHHTLVAPHLPFTIHLSHPIYHSPYTHCTHLPFTIHLSHPSTIHHTLIALHHHLHIHHCLTRHTIYHSPYTRRTLSTGDTVTTVTSMSRWANQFLRLQCTLCGKQIGNSTGLAQHYRNDHPEAFDNTGEVMERLGTEANWRSSK